MDNSKKAMEVRDEYILKQIEIAKERIENGDELHDINTLLLKEKNQTGNPSFTFSQIRGQV